MISNFSIVLMIASAFLAAAGQLLLKVGADGCERLTEFINLWVGAGLFCYGLGMAIWLFVLSRESISHVYAFTVLTFVLVIFGGVTLLDEQLTLSAVVGTAIVLVGLMVIVTNPL